MVSVDKQGERKVGGRDGERKQVESVSVGDEGMEDVTKNARNECEKSAVSVEREYLKCKQTALSEIEFKCEMEERRRRKNNILVRGIRTVGKGINEEVESVIKKFLGIEIYIEKLSIGGGGIIVKLESFKNKLEIIKRKGMLKGVNLWIEDDYTEREREREVQEWLDKIAKEERANGLETKVGYAKIKVDGDWYRWDEREGRVEQFSFREKKARE